MRISRLLFHIACGIVSCCSAGVAATSCSIDIGVWTPSGQITNPNAPVSIVSTDHFNSGGSYEYTLSGQGSAFAATSGSNCGITNVSYALTAPLTAFGGSPTPTHPLQGVNVEFLDSRSDRPLPSYPYTVEGTITFSGINSTTKEGFSRTLSVILVITKQTD